MSDHTPQGISGGETHTSVSSFLHPGLPAGGAPEMNESQGTGRKQPGEEEREGAGGQKARHGGLAEGGRLARQGKQPEATGFRIISVPDTSPAQAMVFTAGKHMVFTSG